jgi:hypothetical protein
MADSTSSRATRTRLAARWEAGGDRRVAAGAATCRRAEGGGGGQQPAIEKPQAADFSGWASGRLRGRRAASWPHPTSRRAGGGATESGLHQMSGCERAAETRERGMPGGRRAAGAVDGGLRGGGRAE